MSNNYVPCPFCGMPLGRVAMERFGMVKHMCNGKIRDTGDTSR